MGMGQISGQQWPFQPHPLGVPSAFFGEVLPDTLRLRQQAESDHLKTSPPSSTQTPESLPSFLLVTATHSCSCPVGAEKQSQ